MTFKSSGRFDPKFGNTHSLSDTHRHCTYDELAVSGSQRVRQQGGPERQENTHTHTVPMMSWQDMALSASGSRVDLRDRTHTHTHCTYDELAVSGSQRVRQQGGPEGQEGLVPRQDTQLPCDDEDREVIPTLNIET